MSNILVIGDTHLPFEKAGYLDFCKRTRDKFDCQTIVHIGDEVEHHALSTHKHDPSGFSAGHEFEAAYKKMQDWFRAFPKVRVCIGNHGERMFRRAVDVGLPASYLKSYKEVWDAPKDWNWAYSWEVHNILFTHGTNRSGLYPHALLAKSNRQSSVMGHCHSVAGVEWFASKKDIIFGMAVGSGMDVDSYAAKYAEHYSSKPIISCGVILNDGRAPFIVKMEL